MELKLSRRWITWTVSRAHKVTSAPMQSAWLNGIRLSARRVRPATVQSFDRTTARRMITPSLSSSCGQRSSKHYRTSRSALYPRCFLRCFLSRWVAQGWTCRRRIEPGLVGTPRAHGLRHFVANCEDDALGAVFAVGGFVFRLTVWKEGVDIFKNGAIDVEGGSVKFVSQQEAALLYNSVALHVYWPCVEVVLD